MFLTLLSANKNDQYVLLISFDGFRADYIDWYDTPNFDQIKLNGVKAKSLKPVFPTKTFPNHYSIATGMYIDCLLYTSPSPRDGLLSRMPSSA